MLQPVLRAPVYETREFGDVPLLHVVLECDVRQYWDHGVVEHIVLEHADPGP